MGRDVCEPAKTVANQDDSSTTRRATNLQASSSQTAALQMQPMSGAGALRGLRDGANTEPASPTPRESAMDINASWFTLLSLWFVLAI